MSRLLIIFLSIALLGNAGAAVSGLYTYDINPDNVSVTIADYPTSATGAIEIPATIDGRSVTSIGDYAFYNFSSLTSVIIPDSVTSIGNDAFYNCSSLTSVTIPDSVTSIGSGAFRECSGLASVTIGNSVTSIGIYAFYGCSGLTSVTIPDSVTSIGSRAFYSCTNLASISFQSMAAPTIGSDAFLSISAAAIIYYPYGATGYAATYDGVPTTDDGSVQPFDGYNYEINPDNVSVTITDYPTSAAGAIEIPATIYGRSVTSIGDYAFYNFSSLTSVIIPDSVTSIGDYAFGYCGSLTSVTIGNSVTSIGDGAFYNCYGLTSVIIPDSVTSIGSGAFYNCYGLTSVIIPDSVTSIGSGAFYNCSNLASIRLQSIVAPGIGPSAFVGISATAMLHYRQGATGYEATYDGVPTLEDHFTYFTAGEVATATTEAQQAVIAAPASYNLYALATAQAELIDLRTGSTMLNISGSNAVMQLQIQRSDDLSTWTSSAEDLIEVELPMQQGKGFYRFAMPQE